MCDICSICLEEMIPGTRYFTNCKHVFHNTCIDELKQSGATLCPLCRFQIFKDPIEKEIETIARELELATEKLKEELEPIIREFRETFWILNEHSEGYEAEHEILKKSLVEGIEMIRKVLRLSTLMQNN